MGRGGGQARRNGARRPVRGRGRQDLFSLIRRKFNEYLSQLRRGDRKPRLFRTERSDHNLVEIVSQYDSFTGLTGTAGTPTTPGQALASAVEEIGKAGSRALQRRDQPAPRRKAALLEAYAVVTTVNPRVYWDQMAYYRLMSMFDRIVGAWPFELAKGAYRVHKLVDYSEYTTWGACPVVAVATDQSRVVWLKNLISRSDLKVEYHATIQGMRDLPKPKSNVKVPHYRTWKQG